jgi:hypothetical protein
VNLRTSYLASKQLRRDGELWVMKYGAALPGDAGAEVSGHEVQGELKAEELIE